MITDQEQLRSVALNQLQATINAIGNLKATQPPFSDSALAMTEEANTLRNTQTRIKGLRLHG